MSVGRRVFFMGNEEPPQARNELRFARMRRRETCGIYQLKVFVPSWNSAPPVNSGLPTFIPSIKSASLIP